ncbi:Unknown protein [Striga hermonthica]|uniref:F-box domain-containing protein n=1 Tax=Striga hermonthica TaxID=68872 RepID=A0A9N7RL57_STRHE|nr:Unknown protein [Striga hermonthica]
MADDRLSQLPIPILHHILCSLSQEAAVRTCILSKQWRHIGSTRPNLDFSEDWLSITPEKFVSVVDRIIQEYRDQNLSIHKLHLEISSPDSRRIISLLDKWIPMIAALNVKVFKLDCFSETRDYYDLPSAVFLAESLEELHLCQCRVSPVESVQFKCLRKLTLIWVKVDGGTFETITSGCPLLRSLVIDTCWGLRNVRLSEATLPGLKHFELDNFKRIKGCSIEINVLNIETVRIEGPWIWSNRQSTFLFSRLTSLRLYYVILSSESFDLLSFRCPILESLTLHNCSGFEEFHLASNSVKWLRISTSEILLKGARICAPNILNFTFIAHISQALHTFCFTTTTSKEWCSQVVLSSSHKDYPNFRVDSWFLGLRRLLKALSGSRISLFLQMDNSSEDLPWSAVRSGEPPVVEPPVVVRNLNFATCKCRTVSWYMGFTNALFRVCQPSYVWGGSLVSEPGRKYRFTEFQLNIYRLANGKVRTPPYFLRHNLEQVFVEALDEQPWHLMQWSNEMELQKWVQDGKIGLRLKWRFQNKLLAMDPDLKRTVVEDLDRFVRRKDNYRSVGKAWRRG